MRINSSKYAQDIYIEKYRILPREDKNDINKYWGIPCSWIGKHSIVKMPIFPNLIYIFKSISKLQKTFIESDRLNLILHGNTKGLL